MDPVSNMLTIIRNAQLAGKDIANIPFSNLKYEIAKILARNGFVQKAEKESKKDKNFIEITLKYYDKTPAELEGRQRRPAISGLERTSKPGQRIYTGSRQIKKVKGGYGIAIISTSKGLMTNKEARRQKLGGEIICEVW